MPFMAPFVYGRASLYGPYPIRMPNHARRTGGGAVPTAKPLRPLTALQHLGIPRDHAQVLLNTIAESGDRPYHAGKLWNGNAYLITQNDVVYYGQPAHLEKLDDVLASRTKCIDHPVRRFSSTPHGLTIAVSSQGGRQQATAHTKLFCVTMPLPHSNQVAFRSRPKPQPQADNPPSR